MPPVIRSQYHPEVGGASYYYPGEDFRAWRAQFEALREHERWSDLTARQYANACMRDTAHDAVRDITLAGPRSCSEMLDAYEERFFLLEDLVRLRMRQEGLLRAPRRRHQPGEKRRSLLKPRAKRGILTPTTRPLAPWNAGRVVRIEASGGRMEDIALTSNSEDVRRETFFSRVRSILRGLPEPRAKDLQNLACIPPQPLSPGSPPSDTPPHLRAGPSQRSDGPDFQLGQ